MYLRSLTLRGFKSFASTTTLNFEPGITCVVGPNGSGKSNVVDALSWVMGEQGAKTLRGGKMEDVIFAGTAKRAPLGRAEVVLTIDNTDGALPIDYTEVTISRTMFRSGGSEYAINGSPARLLDIQELLSDSGIGREMHVIVGQGQLDTVLQATPETRRQFIEEAAGVLKHRKRKEKALRKLEATDVNLNRLTDLLAELRRQLRPLGRQAEVARKAAVIQADLRDAKARLLADDLARADVELATDQAAEERLTAKRLEVEAALEAARVTEEALEQEVAALSPRLAAAQEEWYSLSAVGERVSATAAIAAVKHTHAVAAAAAAPSGRDPEATEAEAAAAREQEQALAVQVAAREQVLAQATQQREAAELAAEAAETAYSRAQRAVADRREGLARLSGEVNTVRSRLEARRAELGRLAAAEKQAATRFDEARIRFATLETEVAQVAATEPELDLAYERAESQQRELEQAMAELAATEQSNRQERAAAAARLEALRANLDRQDGAAALLVDADRPAGVLGSITDRIRVEPGFEAAISAALGPWAEAVALTDLDAALSAFARLKAADQGRAGALISGASVPKQLMIKLPPRARFAVDLVSGDSELSGALGRLLAGVVVVEDLAAARDLVAQVPEAVAVTLAGEILSESFAAGGSSAKPSLLQVQAAVTESEIRLANVQAAGEKLAFERARLHGQLETASAACQTALDRLHASDASYSALTEELALWAQTMRAARAEIDRAAAVRGSAEAASQDDEQRLVELEERLSLAANDSEVIEVNPQERDLTSQAAAASRQAEMEARLALRTLQERVRALAGRAESLERAAAEERDSRVQIAAAQQRAQRQASLAGAVLTATTWLAEVVAQAKAGAAKRRQEAQEQRGVAETALVAARQDSRRLAKDFEQLVTESHRDELLRAEQRMRIQQLQDKAIDELGLDPGVLVAEYGPTVPVPVVVATDDGEEPRSVPFVRAEQEKRLARAQRDLSILGKINPLALEEFEAMQERHAFLAEQLDDLKKTRADLMSIIKDVDARVEEVFQEAYVDVAAAFETSFDRLFPGGEGRLVLTDPTNWLTTGVEVEARPAGKKIKRLSLLSGGERALVAVAFLVALFKARPSPFYILDEVEAALDDTNLGRLLDIYEELRDNSQLLVITHQKRTMEIADALYGVTMRADGVSTVISQRLRDE